MDGCTRREKDGARFVAGDELRKARLEMRRLARRVRYKNTHSAELGDRLASRASGDGLLSSLKVIDAFVEGRARMAREQGAKQRR